MSLLDTVSIPKRKPPIITIVGESGCGKTSLAATMPKPIFIRAEDGMQSVHSPAFPLLTSSNQLFGQLRALYKEKHDYQTVVIDSVTALDVLFTKHIIETDSGDAESLNRARGGYGNGVQALVEMHRRTREACGFLRDERGMNVVFIAHAETETVDPPDGDSFTKYTFRLNKKAVQHYESDVDLIGFLKIQAYISDGKALTDGSRTMTVTAGPAQVAKNRFGLESDLRVVQGENPFAVIMETKKDD